MEKVIVEDYEIAQETCALLQAKHTHYDTIVLELTRTLYIRKTPLQLIKAACIEGGADYNGRRKSVIHKTGAKHNVPIPVSPNEGIYFLPTHSPKHEECCWINFNQLKNYYPNRKNTAHSTILFNNGQELHLEMSYSRLRRQIERTSICVRVFTPNFTALISESLYYFISKSLKKEFEE